MKLSLTIVLAAIAGSALAADKMNLSQLESDATKHHPALAAANADLESAKAQKTGLLAPFKPQLSFNAYGATGNGSMIFPGTVQPTNYAILPGGSTELLNGMLMWKFFSFGRDRALSDSGSFFIKSQESSLRSLLLGVTLGVRLAFADALNKVEILTADRAAYDSAVEVLRITQARFDAGKVPEAFVLRAKADVARTERDIAMAEADAQGADASLWEASGLDQTPKELGLWDEPLNAPASKQEAMKFAETHRPELLMIQAAVDQAKALGIAADKSKLPELTLMAMNNYASNRGMAGSNTYKAGLTLSFPIGDGGRRYSEKQESTAMVAKSEAELKGVRNKIGAEVASSWAEWSAASKVSASAHAEVEASEEAYRVALIRYQEGKAILSELTDSRSQLTHARLSVAESNAYARKAWSKLTKAIG
jgi:outer membrane protein